MQQLKVINFFKDTKAKSYTIHEPTLQLDNCDMNFHLDTWYSLITNNRHIELIKPTIRQAPLHGDKEST